MQQFTDQSVDPFWKYENIAVIYLEPKAYLMVSNSLTLESWKVRSLRPELESLTNIGSFFTLLGQNQQYIHTDSLKSLFPIEFPRILHIFSKICWNYCYYLNVNSKNLVKLARELLKFCLTARHPSVFRKVRELVGEIKYAFAWNTRNKISQNTNFY